MKKMNLLVMLAALLFSVGCNAKTGDTQTEKSTTLAKNIEVYYFHFERRCATCEAVEYETKKALETLYPAEMKSGQISFTSLNFSDKASAPFVQKAKAEGQSMLIVSGNTRIDITDKAFMYARSNSEKLKEEIKKAIDSILTQK